MGRRTNLPVFASRQGFVPSARPTKFATAIGTYFWYNSALIMPSEVSKMAYRPGFRDAGGCCAPGVDSGIDTVIRTRIGARRFMTFEFFSLSLHVMKTDLDV